LGGSGRCGWIRGHESVFSECKHGSTDSQHQLHCFGNNSTIAYTPQ
jgi:hypothetical protein